MKVIKNTFNRICGHSGVVWSKPEESIQAIIEHKDYDCADCVLNNQQLIDEFKTMCGGGVS